MRARWVTVAVMILVLSACGSATGSGGVTESASPSPAPVASTSASPTPLLVAFGPVTEVTGTEECGLNEGELTTDADGTMHYREGSAVCSVKNSDPRVAGGGFYTWERDAWESDDAGAAVQWGKGTLENSGGKWVGTYTGIVTSATGDLITFWYTGTGDYEGLSYFMWQEVPVVNGLSQQPGTTHGLIFPGKPPTP
jgi:hypothetical protein